MQKDFFKNKKRSMAYYAFFIEGIEVAWTCEKLMQNEREKETKNKKNKNQQKNVYQKEKKSERNLKKK